MTEAQTRELINQLAMLTETIKSSGNMGAGSGLRDISKLGSAAKKSAEELGKSVVEEKRRAQAYKKSTEEMFGASAAIKSLREESNAYAGITKVAHKHMENMVQAFEPEQLDKAHSKFQQYIEKSNNTLAKEIASRARTTEDFVGMQRTFTDELIKDFKAAKKANLAGKHKEAAQLLAKHNLKLGDLDHTVEELKEANEQLAEATIRAGHHMTDTSSRMQSLKSGAMAAAGALAAIVPAAIKTAESAAKTGTQMEYLDAALMGMQPEELNQLQKDYKQIIIANGQSLDEFNETIEQGIASSILFTGSLREGARVNAQSVKLAKILNTNQEQYMREQMQLYERLHNSLSMTAEEFMELRTQLIDNQSVQSRLYRLNNRQRKAYMDDLMLTYDRLRTMGLMEEQAKRVLDVFAEMGAKSPRERMKEAAKLQAVMGAMGMGERGARAAGLLRAGKTGTEEFATIMRDVNVAVGERMSQSFASEMMTMQMIQSAGLQQYLGPDSPLAQLNTQQNIAIDEAAKARAETNNWLEKQLGEFTPFAKQILEWAQKIETILSNSIGANIAKILGVIIGWNILKGLGRGILNRLGAGGAARGTGGTIKRIFGKGGSFFSSLKSLFGKGGAFFAGLSSFFGKGIQSLFSKIVGSLKGLGFGGLLKGAARFAGGIGAAATGGYAVGTAIDKTIEKLAPEFHDKMSDTIGGTLTHLLATFGVDEAQQTLKRNQQTMEQMNKIRQKEMELLKQQNETSKVIAEEVKKGNEEYKRQSEKLNETAKGTTKAVEHQTDEQKNIAKEEQEQRKKGYRVQWQKIPRNTQAVE